MKILRAIGRFFAKIGRWIRDTAWVQPLLIVGGIFAIVFSIPYLTAWIKSWSDHGPEHVAYYNKFKAAMNDEDDKNDAKANQIFTYLMDYGSGKATAEQKDKYGEKFFIAFVQDDCSGCEDNYSGFEYAQKQWNKNGYDIEDNNKFVLYTISIDKTVKKDNKNSETVNVFQKYFYDRYSSIFEETSQSATESYYFLNQGGESSTYASELKKMETSDSFSSPTVFLIDLTNNAPDYTNKYGVSEVVFTYEGTAKGGADTSTSQAKAQTIVDAWNHKGIFASDYNK